MMRKSVFLGFFAVLAFSATAFAQDKDFKWPPMLRVATPSAQTGSFASTNGWAPMLQEFTGMMVRVVPEDSEVRRYMRFTNGKEFELVSTSIAEHAYATMGNNGYASVKPVPVRVVWHHNDTPWGWAVRGDSKYKTIYDLKQKGVRVALSTQSPPMMKAAQEALPAFIGWTKEEAAANWTFVPVGSYAEGARSIPDGKADVAYVATISSITQEMEAHPKGLRWLPMPLDDNKGWEGYLQHRPTAIPTTLDFGVKSSIGVDSISSNFIYWTRPDVDQEMIYHLAKWFHGSFDQYKDTHGLSKRMSMKHFRNFLNHSPFPVAEGTVKYLKEIGEWTAKDDKWNEEMTQKMDRWIEARTAAMKEAKDKGVKLHWQDKEYLDILEKHTKDLEIFKTRL